MNRQWNIIRRGTKQVEKREREHDGEQEIKRRRRGNRNENTCYITGWIQHSMTMLCPTWFFVYSSWNNERFWKFRKRKREGEWKREIGGVNKREREGKI